MGNLHFLGSVMFHATGPRRERRAWPIHAYVGPNGGGKSACAVWDSMPSLDMGRTVLSTVRLLDFRESRTCDALGCDTEGHGQGHMAAHPSYVPFTTWQQLLDAEHCDVIMDEVTGVASSRESHGLPAAVANLLVQLRRRDVVLRWTAPNWARADKIIRECTQAVTYCMGRMPKEVEDDASERSWRHRRMLRWKTYDSIEFDEFTEGKRDAAKPFASQFWWLPGSEITLAYDTFDSVSTIGTVNDAGRCYSCGGRRSVPACKCGSNHEGSSMPASGVGRQGTESRPAGPAIAIGGRRRSDRVPASVEVDSGPVSVPQLPRRTG